MNENQETRNFGDIMTLILEDTKLALGIGVDNLGFDSELLLFVNSAKATLVHFGLIEFDIDIDESTEWPPLGSSAVMSHVKTYVLLKVKQNFDPTASETIAKSISSSVVELEGRITYEVEEIANP